jgi:RND family efflux transporter MFP subunit
MERTTHTETIEPAGGNGHREPSDHERVDLNVPKPRPIWVVLMGLLGMGALAALLATGWIPRHKNEKELIADAQEAANAPVLVNVATPRRSKAEEEIALPATLRPWQEVSLFARTTGYLRKYYVDISNEVKAGQLMAEIDAPEVDEELAQASAALLQMRASLLKSKADRDLAQSTLKRFQAMRATQSVTPQELDEKQAALDVAESNVQSATASVAASEANVRRLTEMQKFEKINAPFAGVVSGRGYDVGSLIMANPTTADAKPLFKIAENDILRAFVNVPQSAALKIRKGMEVKVTVRERPGEVFAGNVMGTTNYLDPNSRSLLTEVKLPNVKGADGAFKLLPGMYVQASFKITHESPPLVIPGPALVDNAAGTQVAVVQNGKVHFKKVQVGQDFGTEIEVVGGLEGNEQVIANPGERVVEGVAVSTGHEGPAPSPAQPAPPTVKVSAAKN